MHTQHLFILNVKSKSSWSLNLCAKIKHIGTLLAKEMFTPILGFLRLFVRATHTDGHVDGRGRTDELCNTAY